jgi:predicted dehydrogenase
MNTVRLGIIGVGNMGSSHAANILNGRVKRCELTALCDRNPARCARFPQIKSFTDSRELIRSGLVDAVVIATPHYDHTTIGIDALQQGLHVMVEKPISVHKADAQRLLAAHKNKKQVFAAMFQQRTEARYRKLRQLIQSGELGEIRRIHWTITNWFRPQAYYDSGGWRATWAGEGGGVLLNQSPHNIDMFQHLFGMPARVRAFCQIARYHKIEVEDEVTAYFEYKNRTSAVFVTSTGEAPGANRLEIAAERGLVVLEGHNIHFTRNEAPMSEFCRTATGSFSRPDVWEATVPVKPSGGGHAEVLENFADAILDGAPLIAPAAEGIRAVELANAMLYSSFSEKTIELPLQPRVYERFLKKLIAQSRYKQKPAREEAPAEDFSKSLGR